MTLTASPTLPRHATALLKSGVGMQTTSFRRGKEGVVGAGYEGRVAQDGRTDGRTDGQHGYIDDDSLLTPHSTVLHTTAQRTYGAGQ